MLIGNIISALDGFGPPLHLRAFQFPFKVQIKDTYEIRACQGHELVITIPWEFSQIVNRIGHRLKKTNQVTKCLDALRPSHGYFTLTLTTDPSGEKSIAAS
jgi:hypothetical protein